MARRRREDEYGTQQLPALTNIAGLQQTEEEVTIDLMELLTQILDHWVLIVICALLCTMIMGVCSC